MAHFINHYNEANVLSGSTSDQNYFNLIGVVANNSIPNSSSNGVVTPIYANEYGQIIPFASNQANNSMDVSEIAPAQLQSLSVTYLNAVTSTGSSASTDLSNYSKHSIMFTGVNCYTSQSQFEVYVSNDDSGYMSVYTSSIGSGSTIITNDSFTPALQAINYLKIGLTQYTAGTYTVNGFHKV